MNARRSKTNLEALSQYNCSIRAGRVSESERVGRGDNHARSREVWHLVYFYIAFIRASFPEVQIKNGSKWLYMQDNPTWWPQNMFFRTNKDVSV